jgi:UDP-N-acetylmuramate--alanine ligase
METREYPMISNRVSLEKTFKSFPATKNRFHFVGVGGIGMSGIAYVCRRLGFAVSGSDLRENRQTQRLASVGCRISLGHRAENVRQADIVVVSTAIAQTNAELIEARRLGIPIWHRSELLQFLIMGRRCIAVAGTHGKTTISSMAAHALIGAGLDPTVFIGGELKEIGGNSRLGQSPWVVIEADESDRSFLNYTPEIAVINNIDFDHAEYYKDVHEVEAAFLEFSGSITQGGAALLGWDSPRVRELGRHLSVPAVPYGREPNAGLWISDYQSLGQHSRFLVHRAEELLGEVKLGIPGEFNAVNSLAVIGLGLHLGIPFRELVKHVGAFRGVGRRFDKKGSIHGITVIDDYAHHPAEIRATLSALSERYSGRKVGVFQPHRYTRTKAFAKEFAKALESLDVLILTDIYSASEEPIDDIDGTTILRYVTRDGLLTEYIPDVKEVADYLADRILEPGDVLITLGAGTVTTVGDAVLERIKSRSYQEVS